MPEAEPVEIPQPDMVTERFTFSTSDGTTFTDALVMPRAEFEALTPQQKKDMKRARYFAWRERQRKAPPVDMTKMTKAQLRIRRDELRDAVNAEALMAAERISNLQSLRDAAQSELDSRQ